MSLHLRVVRSVIDIHSHLHHMQGMIHCICNNINTAKVEAAALKGAETAACVQKACGTRFNCGQCRTDINERLHAWRMANQTLEAAE